MRRSAILALVLSLAASAQETPRPREITADELWAVLLQGNRTFVGGRLTFDELKKERDELKEHQAPPVTILSCSDSRLPPELLFNQSLGALFVVRSAGNVVDDFGVASIEFAILNGYTRLIVVLGHDNCGALKAALGGADPNTKALGDLARRLRASFIGVPYDSRDLANVRRAGEMNARASAANLLASSRVIRDAVMTGSVKIVPAFYELGTGEVKKLD